MFTGAMMKTENDIKLQINLTNVSINPFLHTINLQQTILELCGQKYRKRL